MIASSPPHRPVILELEVRRARSLERRLSRPRTFPPEVPHGPHPPGIHIDWEGFDVNRDVNIATAEWYAAAECEISTVYGTPQYR